LQISHSAFRRGGLAVAWLALLVALAACGAAEPDAERGRQLFMGERPIAGGNLACVECHAVGAGEASRGMGQNLSNVGARAASTVPGQEAEAYLRAAIVEPDAFLSGGYQEGIHPRTYGAALSDAEVADLIAYLLTLQSGVD
jgi:cytochrome c oxidase subunit II